MKLTGNGNRMKLRNQPTETNIDWRRVLVGASALALLVQFRIASSKAASVPGTWKVIPGIAANQSSFPVGQDIAVISADDIWQVGNAATGHWDGAAWSSIPPAGNFVALSGVAAVQTNDVWAVGNAPDAADESYNAVTEHWDGSKWTLVPSPNPKGSSQNTLTGVAALNANDIWAVGYTLTTNNQTLTMHWNGSKWSLVPSPNGLYGNWLFGVTAPRNQQRVGCGGKQQWRKYADLALERFELVARRI